MFSPSNTLFRRATMRAVLIRSDRQIDADGRTDVPAIRAQDDLTSAYLNAVRRDTATAVASARSFLEGADGAGRRFAGGIRELRWLLDGFAYRDGERLSAREQRRLYRTLVVLVRDATGDRWTVDAGEVDEFDRVPVSIGADRARWARYPAPVRLAAEQAWRNLRRRRDPRTVFIGIAQPRVTAETLKAAREAVREALEDLVASGRCRWRPVAAQLSASVEPGALSSQFAAPLPDALVIAALALVETVTPSRVRRCRYGPAGARCGRVFVAVKRQRYCEAHRRAAKRDRDARAQARHRAKRGHTQGA
jgi:hypothetical protein